MKTFVPAVRAGILSALAVFMAACSSIGISEPNIISTVTPRATFAPGDDSSSPEPVFASEGEALFAMHCTSCHGPQGHGDGPSVRSGTIDFIPDFHRPDTMTVRTPEEIFTVISEGRLEKLMPPWKDVLTEQQRQSLADFIYNLGVN